MTSFDEHPHRLTTSQVRSSAEAEVVALPSPSAARVGDQASRSASQERASQGKSLIWEVAQTVLLTVAIFLAVRMVIQNFRVEGASMDPTLKSGQFLLINKITYLRLDDTPLESLVPRQPGSVLNFVFGGPKRGDIVVFHSPGYADKDYIKRVIGLPGETVRIVNGRVFIDGAPLDEQYVRYEAHYDLETKSIPADSYFVLGDNRPNSSDSHLGWFVPAESIIGKAWLSYWPPSLWGVLEGATYNGGSR